MNNIFSTNVYKEFDEEKKLYEERMKKNTFFVVNRICPDYEHLESRKAEEMAKLFTVDILNLLNICGLDMNMFEKSLLYKSGNFLDLVLDLHGRIYGYMKGARGPMNFTTLTAKLNNDDLIISDSNKTYKYTVDEHSLIYVNGKEIPNQWPFMSDKEIQDLMQELHDEAKQFGKRVRKLRIESEIASKDFISD